MKRHNLAKQLILSGMILLAPGLCWAQGSAQTGKMTPFDELPDWTGIWAMQGGTIFDKATQTGKGGSLSHGVREHPPYNKEWEAKYEEHLALRDADRYPDPQSVCGIPVGFPRIFNLPDGYEFVVRPDEFYIIAENGGNTMRVYTDGRPLPKREDTWGTYTGVSVGHWEGDTLVFETIGLKGDRDNDTVLDRTGLVLSDEVKITTRMRKTADDMLEARMTIEDPKAMTAPWEVVKTFRRNPKPGQFLYDYGCAENQRNPVDPDTGQTLTIGPNGEVYH